MSTQNIKVSEYGASETPQTPEISPNPERLNPKHLNTSI